MKQRRFTRRRCNGRLRNDRHIEVFAFFTIGRLGVVFPHRKCRFHCGPSDNENGKHVRAATAICLERKEPKEKKRLEYWAAPIEESDMFPDLTQLERVFLFVFFSLRGWLVCGVETNEMRIEAVRVD